MELQPRREIPEWIRHVGPVVQQLVQHAPRAYNLIDSYLRQPRPLTDVPREVHSSLRALPSNTMVARKRKLTKKPMPKKKKAKSAKQTARSTIRRTNATGIRKIRRGAKARVSTASKLGYELTYENGGVVGDGNCVYIGHCSRAPQTEWAMFTGALYRMLMRKAGADFSSWQDLPSFISISNFAVRIRYTFQTIADEIGLQEGFYTVDLLGTHSENINDFEGVMQNEYSAAPDLTWKQVSLELFDTGSSVETVATVNIDACQMHYTMVSTLRLQNRTLDGIGDPTDKLINSVTNNPLLGMRYEAKGKGFRTRFPVLTAEGAPPAGEVASGAGFGANTKVGLILARSQFTNPTNTNKPVDPSFFQNLQRVNKIQITPGGIREDKLVEKYKRNPNSVFKQLDIGGTVSTKGLKFEAYGRSVMVGLEKAMTTGAENVRVEVGFQIDRKHYCYLTERKSLIAQRVNVQNTGYAM